MTVEELVHELNRLIIAGMPKESIVRVDAEIHLPGGGTWHGAVQVDKVYSCGRYDEVGDLRITTSEMPRMSFSVGGI